MTIKYLTIALTLYLITGYTYSQNSEISYKLTLDEVITLAADSSLDAFISQNNYLAGYWVYKNYKAGKLPFLDLNSKVADYNRSVQEEYSFADSSYQYINKQTLNSYFNLSLNQNIIKTGGRIYIDSDIGRLENLTGNSPVQYTSTIIRVGLEQKLFGFNPFKWDKKIEPLRFEQEKKTFIESIEKIALRAVSLFFQQMKAQVNLEIANNNYANAKTLFEFGNKRYQIASISQEDLFTLELDLY